MNDCTKCGKNRWRSERRAVKYDALPYVTLTDIEVRVCEECGTEETVIPAMESLVQVLSHLVIIAFPELGPTEIRFLRKAIGWSKDDAIARLEVDPDDLSRWETGAAKIPASTANLLRVLAVKERPIEDYEMSDLVRTMKAAPPPASGGLVMTRSAGRWGSAQQTSTN